MSSPTSRAWAHGGVVFAAVLMMLTGVFEFIQGIAGIAKDQFFIVSGNYAYKLDTTAWGWIHLFFGLLIAATGFLLLTSHVTWARYIAIGLVMLQALAQFFWIPYYPLWALLIIAMDIFIIWALVVAPEAHEADTLT